MTNRNISGRLSLEKGCSANDDDDDESNDDDNMSY
jgi:hypothetical protein